MVMNILNKNKEPQPMFKIELEPECQTLKKNEVHPIYKLQLLLHRRITVEEPHKIVERWFADWRIKINETKSRHVTFTLNRQTCPPCTLNNTFIPQADVVTYLGVHLDRRLTWRRHIESKRTHMKLKAANLRWLINYNSPLSLEYKVLLYNTVLKPIWTYGCELWGNASKTNIEIIQRAQSTILRTITGAPWYLRSESIHRDLHINLVNEEIQMKKSKHQAKLAAHENPLAKSLTRVYSQSRLKRKDSPAQQRNPRAVSN